MTFQNKTVQKFISLLIIVAVLAPAFVILTSPHLLKAQMPVIDTTQVLQNEKAATKLTLKEILLKFAMAIVRKLLDKMTQATINWINSGFKGKPLFVENPGLFFNKMKEDEVKNFLNIVAYDYQRFPFGKDYALGLINQTKNTFENNAQYSLSKFTNDQSFLDSCRNDFHTCGWDGLLMNIIFPQNNSLGFQMMANEEMLNRLEGPGSKVAKIKDDIQKGMGFLSPKVCKSNPNWDADKLSAGIPKTDLPKYDPPKQLPNETAFDYNIRKRFYDDMYNAKVKTTTNAFNARYGCPEGASTTTPGSIVANQIMTALGSKQRQGELGAALGNSLSAIFDALINHFMDQGLTKLAGYIQSIPDPKIGDFSEYGDLTTVSGTYLGNPPANPEPKITVTKNVVNDNGGILTPDLFSVFVDGTPVVPGVASIYSPGTHVVSGTNQPGYLVIVGGDCALDGTVSVPIGISKTCSVTFDDIATAGNTAKLTITKIVINDNGGTLVAGSVPLFVDGNLRVTGTEYTYNTGLHMVSETNQPGYVGTIGGDCAPDGSITLLPNDVKSCTITNDDI